MIKSMTGYGAGELSAHGKRYSVEIKSVNNRYGDFSVKVPRIYGFLEDAVRKRAAEKIKRGKVDIYIGIESEQAGAERVSADAALAEEYLRAMRALSEELQIPCNMSGDKFLKIPDIFKVEKAEEDAGEITDDVLAALENAIDSFDEARLREGEKLQEDLKNHLAAIKEYTADIEKRAPQIVSEYRKKIDGRIRDILGETPYDETRLLTEVAVFSDRVNVNEEIVRLKSHVSRFEELLDKEEPVGRKIDFLIQEMNREINTIGSKSNDLETAGIVINVKAEIEKLREQIQNVE